MSIKQAHYEELLAEFSHHAGAIALLKRYRPYLEMVPSMRRPDDSVITIPLPVVRVRKSASYQDAGATTNSVTIETVSFPCDVAILMCDPEWKIKTGVELFVFIHRPHEDFSDLLSRWRRTQVLLHQEYEWIMPHRHRHLLNDAAEQTRPFFVLFPETPQRIQKGLSGADLPYVVQFVDVEEDAESESSLDAALPSHPDSASGDPG